VGTEEFLHLHRTRVEKVLQQDAKSSEARTVVFRHSIILHPKQKFKIFKKPFFQNQNFMELRNKKNLEKFDV
jgi:hypothetical protein